VQIFQDKEDRLTFGQFEEERDDGLKSFLALALR
jgi:hypothetical protein